MTAATLLTLLSINLLAAISPGPAFVLCARTGAAEGARVAAMVALGMGIGSALWAGLALLGLALVFQVLPAALTALKIIGGLFLVWIAVQMWRHAPEPLVDLSQTPAPRSALSAFRLGLGSQLANPKTATFFGAVFVGLVPPDTGLPTLVLILALIATMEAAWFAFVGRVFSTDTARRVYGRTKTIIDRAFGGLIALFGVKIATS